MFRRAINAGMILSVQYSIRPANMSTVGCVGPRDGGSFGKHDFNGRVRKKK